MKRAFFFCLIFCTLCFGLQAQDDDKTFVESKTEGVNLTYVVEHASTPLSGKPHAYSICVNNPSQWLKAYLCINGDLVKSVKPTRNCFNWSFAALPPGEYTIQILVEASDGSLGLVEYALTV